MKLNRIWAALLICIMMLNPISSIAFADNNSEPETLTYQGGVIYRGYVGGIAPFTDDDQLQLGYALANSPYIILNEPTVWELVVSGGSTEYSCVALLAHQADLSMDPFNDSWSVEKSLNVDANSSFTYTFTKPGRYFWQFEITDSNNQQLMFQTRIYETYSAEDETDETTVVGKVNSIIAEKINSGMSDYTRALVLHDWLINNANYDYTYTHYDASGVLLHGTGVCDSYARAYLMLMTAAGVDCMIVSGTAGGGNHAWNLVKLDGSWYHVDCTWDDPGTGGSERHTYFCVDDDTMALDHTWNRPGDITDTDGMLVPEAPGGEYEDSLTTTQDCDFTFATIEEFDQKFDAEVAAGNYREYTRAIYTGNEDITNVVWPAFQTWFSTQWTDLTSQGLVTSGFPGISDGIFYVKLTWTDPDDYIRINEEKIIVEVNNGYTLKPKEYYPASDAFTWTSSDPTVATVESSYSEEDGLSAYISALSAGKTTITVTSKDGLSDSVEVIVNEAFTPEINLTMTETDSTLELKWDLVPGANQYSVMHVSGNIVTTLSTVTEAAYSLSKSQLPANTVNELQVVAKRVIDGEEAMSYYSDKLSYVQLSFASSLPDGIITIDENAFTGDTALDTLYIPDGAKTIGAGAFSGCSLTAIRIPESVDSIGDGAFGDLDFVQLVKGSTADAWFADKMSSVTVVYED